MGDKRLLHASYKLGRKARKDGIGAVAVLDADLMKLVKRYDAKRQLILSAWHRGWHSKGTN